MHIGSAVWWTFLALSALLAAPLVQPAVGAGLGTGLGVGTGAGGKPEAELSAMRDALRTLHQLDRYYSQVARPRSRSAGAALPHSELDKAWNLLQLQELDRFYAQRTRPRFGKRAMLVPASLAASFQEESGDTVEPVWRLQAARRR